MPAVGDIVRHAELGQGRVMVVTGGQLRVRFGQSVVWIWAEALEVINEYRRDEPGNYVHAGDRHDGRVFVQPVQGGVMGQPAGGKGSGGTGGGGSRPYKKR